MLALSACARQKLDDNPATSLLIQPQYSCKPVLDGIMARLKADDVYVPDSAQDIMNLLPSYVDLSPARALAGFFEQKQHLDVAKPAKCAAVLNPFCMIDFRNKHP